MNSNCDLVAKTLPTSEAFQMRAMPVVLTLAGPLELTAFSLVIPVLSPGLLANRKPWPNLPATLNT
jgi:hypothetical protein